MYLNLHLVAPFLFLTACMGRTPEAGDKANAHPGDTLRGRAVQIIDGDTYDLLAEGNKRVRIRCFGIDAPERGQDYYRKAKDALGNQLQGAELMVVLIDRAGGVRMAGKTFKHGKRVEIEMVRSGMAWHFTRYSQEAELAGAEQEARQTGRGIWSMPDPVAPWLWRSQHRKEHNSR